MPCGGLVEGFQCVFGAMGYKFNGKLVCQALGAGARVLGSKPAYPHTDVQHPGVSITGSARQQAKLLFRANGLGPKRKGLTLLAGSLGAHLGGLIPPIGHGVIVAGSAWAVQRSVLGLLTHAFVPCCYTFNTLHLPHPTFRTLRTLNSPPPLPPGCGAAGRRQRRPRGRSWRQWTWRRQAAGGWRGQVGTRRQWVNLSKSGGAAVAVCPEGLLRDVVFGV